MNSLDLLNILDQASYVGQVLLAAGCGLLCFRRAQRPEGNALFFCLLAGFFLCICMSCLFYLLTWVVEDYPFVFSPGDISWVGGILFLITIAMSLLDQWTPEQRRDAGKYRLPALLAPAVCAAFNITYIVIYPDITFNYLLYGIPNGILSYLSLWLFLAIGKGGSRTVTGSYHLAVLLWVGVQLFYDLFYSLGWDYGYAVPAVVSGWLLLLFTPGIYYGARREAVQ